MLLPLATPSMVPNQRWSWRLMVCCGCATAASVAAVSQGAQDAILRDIFSRIGTTNKFDVEFGFNAPDWEGGSGANTEELHKAGWR